MKMASVRSLRALFLFLSWSRLEILSADGGDVYEITDETGYGRRFDGVGAVSGGGATSKLLRNYPENLRGQILDYLFKPNFAASLHLLKVEIGGDGQSTDGTEASHMHSSWDENYFRGYEWWLMKEAKARNPNILLYGLPWTFPGWIGNSTGDSPYVFPDRLAGYLIKWIQGAKIHHNLTINYLGYLRKALDASGLEEIQVVAGDLNPDTWKIAPDILRDPEFAAAIDIIGGHYSATFTTDEALKTQKPLWSSEDFSAFNSLRGGGCWARIINRNYVNGFMTSTIAWNLVSSYYTSLPVSRCSLMNADQPWSGHYEVQSPIWMSAHTTQFTEPGWQYLRHGFGVGRLAKGGSYVSLVSPSMADFTMVIETMSYNNSRCGGPSEPEYQVMPQTAIFTFSGSFANISELIVWHSKLNFEGESSVLFQKLDSVMVVNRSLAVTLEVDEIYTFTTLSGGAKKKYSDPPPARPFPLPYKENFEDYAENAEADNFAQQMGTFEVISENETLPNQFYRQMAPQEPVYWCLYADTGLKTLNLIGNSSWSDIGVEADVRVPSINGTSGTFIAARVDKGGCNARYAKGIFFFLFPGNSTFMLANDLAGTSPIIEGHISVSVNDWNTLGLSLKGSHASGYINEQQIFYIPVPSSPASGFVAMGTASYGAGDFDNFVIMQNQDDYLRFQKN